MPEFITGILKQLEPLTALIIYLLIIAVVALFTMIKGRDKIIKNKDDEIERLRTERNLAVDKKDTDLKEANDKVIELHEKTMETISKIGREAEVRSIQESAKTDAIAKSLDGMYQVLINIKK